ncbi:ABC transporter permease [Pygmaiobacter massiliensis]|uniref:ABC transporter permease n=1 Tax=Pygmaiobacter massiliensis TaxID=1917873 RepID=UPI0028997656|nr:ABC transporter permease [Pygmaiobacter massiliensis]
MATKKKKNLAYKLNKGLSRLLPALGTIALALLVGGIIIAISGNNPLEAYAQMFKGAFGSKSRISETLVKTVPLMLLALGVSVAFRSQIWNIGADGQFTIGAIFAICVTLYLPGENIFILLLSFVAAFVGGALWGGLSGFLKAKFNANEVITTLMLNYVAQYLLAYLIRGPLMDPNGGNNPQSASIPEAYRLPRFVSNLRINYGIFIGLAVLIFIYYFWRSAYGYKLKLVGASNTVAKYAGLKVSGIVLFTMVLSGGIAGIAGWTEVFGAQYRLLDNISSGYGNLAIVVALLGNLRPIDIGIASFFFAALMSGGNAMQRMTEVPYSVVDIIQGLIIVFVICRTVAQSNGWKQWIAARRNAHKAVTAGAAEEDGGEEDNG